MYVISSARTAYATIISLEGNELTLYDPVEEIEQRFSDDPFVATTNKMYSNLVFSFGREYGHFGRILNQTVIPLPTLIRRKSKLFSDKV